MEPASPGAIKAAAVFEFMERNLWILEKTGELIPFIFNEAQIILAQVVARCWHDGVPVRIIVPKGRQMGISTWIEGLAVALTVFSVAAGQAFRSALVSNSDKSSEEVFDITKTFVDHLPDEWKETQKNRNAGALVWPTGASIKVFTVKTGNSLGRGGRRNFFHLTEAAYFCENGVDAAKAYEAIAGSLVKDAESCCFIESTVNGRDPFFCQKIFDSIEGTGRSDFQVVFLPWFLIDAYKLDWNTYRKWVTSNPNNEDPGEVWNPTEEEEQLCRLLDSPVPPGTENYNYRVQLKPEQLIWRRMVRRSDFAGSESAMAREYPSTWREAFRAADYSLFTPEEQQHYAESVREPSSTGVVQLSSLDPEQARATWEERAGGMIRVWDHPDTLSRYLIAVDPASPRGMDYTVGYVFRTADMKIVAAFRGQFEWEVVAETCYALGLYYGKAHLAVENNVAAAICEWLEKHHYPNLHYHTPRWNSKAGQVPGFRTHAGNRKLLLDALGESIRTRRLQCMDRTFADEMGTFVLNERLQRYEAARGRNDDAIIAASIGCLLISQAEPLARYAGPSKSDLAESEKVWEAFKQHLERFGTLNLDAADRGNRW